MKIIVCGAGNVGRSIVGYLTQGNNDIVVIDSNAKNLTDLSKEFDVQPILGNAAHPDILEQAGAKTADLLIAATDNEEANMLSCQVGYTLFSIPRRIARIDSHDYLEPSWSDLYADTAVPVNVIISPDIEIANAIYRILKVPGAKESLPLLDGKLRLLAFKCKEDCPLIKTPLAQLGIVAPNLHISVVSIVRRGQSFIPNGENIFEAGDEIYFLVKTSEVAATIEAFGMEHPANERVLIFGGNQIARNLALKIEKDDTIQNSKIIEEDAETAKSLADSLNNTAVINGQMLSDLILNEAGIDKVDITVAVTENDKDNLLSSLLAKSRGVPETISLVNSRAYNTLLDNIGDSILVDRTAVTISSILKELRKTNLQNAYSLGRGFGELWQLQLDVEDELNGKRIEELELPENSQVCVLYRNDEIIFPDSDEVLQSQDTLLVFVGAGDIKRVEKIFA